MEHARPVRTPEQLCKTPSLPKQEASSRLRQNTLKGFWNKTQLLAKQDSPEPQPELLQDLHEFVMRVRQYLNKACSNPFVS